jgi:phosphoglucosamine mutase
LKHKADAGIAFDGDADRLMAVDHTGAEVDGDQIILILALHMRAKDVLAGPVVATVMSNLGLKMALAEAGIELIESQVGDRYVLQEMLDKGSVIGGEQSGHIILLRESTTGDGILSALHLLSAIKDSGSTLSELSARMTRYPQVLINAVVSTKEGWDKNPVIQDEMQRVEGALGGRGRLLVRASGTEPVIRVLVEGPDEAELIELAESLAAIIRQQQR